MTINRMISVVSVAVFAIATALPRATTIETTPGIRSEIAVTSESSIVDQRAIAARIQALIASGRLRLIDQRDDTLIQGRRHERFQQVYGGLPVLGADVAIQWNGPQLISAMGVLFDGLAIDTAATLSFSRVSASLAARGIRALESATPLSILPTPEGGVALVYTVRGDDGFISYVSADDASVLMRQNTVQTQTTILEGTGGFGDAKKVSATRVGNDYVARDGLRPPALETYDLQGDFNRALGVISGISAVNSNELARQTGETWRDSAVVDAHVHAGFVYDYYYRRFQRRGLDNNDVRIHSMVHPARLQDARTAPSSVIGLFYLNAGYSSACRCMIYGEGLPAGLSSAYPNGVRNFATALDVVAHELTHAVTDASSRLIYANESGALNEAFSDIIGTSVEYFYQPVGSGTQRADYLMGEDLASGSTALVRSMNEPANYGQPEHFFDRQSIGASQFDSGGVHLNSGIANNAYFYAIEGGRHRYSRRTVRGVGAANRDQIEKVFYRAFTSMLSSSSTFYMARVATIQSARDLFGAGSAAETAIADAWDAVGVTSPAAALTTQFSPRSVTASPASCGGAQPSFTFRVSVSEFQRVGFTVQGFAVYSFDSQLRLIRAPEPFPDTTFRAWFNQCQPANTRIAGGATACATLCSDLGGRATGYAAFEFYGVDDNGNAGSFHSDLIAFGLPSLGESGNTLTPPAFRKLVQQ